MFFPKISVITVVFNDAAHLEQTMLGVLNQTYKNIEYIIIDGGSTDGTLDVIKKYADRLTFWVSEADRGIYDAMNKGIDRATGEWINFMNSGDYFYTNDIIERIFASDRSKADLIYGSCIGNFNGYPVECVAHVSVVDKAYEGMRLCHQSLFARVALSKKHPFDLRFKSSADGEFVAWCIVNNFKFERVTDIIFRVGTLGYSDKNWVKARIENWKIARIYFRSFQTDYYHFQHLVREWLFRLFKNVSSRVGVYQLLRYFYRKNLKDKMLPENIKPFEEKL